MSAAGLYAEKVVLTPKTYSGLKSFPSDGGTTKVHAVPEDSLLQGGGLDGFGFGKRLGSALAIRDAALAAAERQKVLDEVAAYNSNGTTVASCEEYAFEKYFDAAAWDALVLVSNATSDHRKAFDLAYGSAALRTSLGTRHLSDPVIRARDGSPSDATVPFEFEHPKNDYFRVPYGGGASRVLFFAGDADTVKTSDDLQVTIVTMKDSTRPLALGGVVFQDAALTAVMNAGQDVGPESFQWHLAQSNAMKSAGVRDEQLELEHQRRDAFLELITQRDEIVRQIAEYASGGNPPPVAGANRFSQRWWLDPLWNPNPTEAVAAIQALTVQATTVPNFNQLNNSQQTFITYSNQVSPTKETLSPSALASISTGPNIQAPCNGSGNPFFCLVYQLQSIDQALEDELHAAHCPTCFPSRG